MKNSSQNSQLALECETQDICSLLLLIQVQVSYATTSGDLDILASLFSTLFCWNLSKHVSKGTFSNKMFFFCLCHMYLFSFFFFLLKKRHIPKPDVVFLKSVNMSASFHKILTKMFYWDPKIFVYYPRRKLGKSDTFSPFDIFKLDSEFRISNFFLLFSLYQNNLFFVVERSFWINNSELLFFKIVTLQARVWFENIL